MNLKKTGIAVAMAAMMMSGAAMAGYGGGYGGTDTDVDVLSNNDLLSDNNVGNGPGHDNNDITTNNGNDDNDIDTNNGNDDNNLIWIDKSNDGNDDNEFTSNNGNDDNTWRNSNNQIDASHNLSFEVDMVLAKSDLDGHISNTSVEYGESASMGYHHHGCNKCAGAGVKVNNTNTMTGFNNAAGITTVGQSAGANSMVQQSVVTNATVQTN
ncbi:hypothetical protein H2O73_02710 [Vibrio sp. 404]|uniref:Uncharacterized protein n=1 Tax=Vibrio marinisediminis TaxID=2758441 RepID=A0A7W2ISL9_9VIBR|nr:hypothetical protein [Vibrio marinisediminis]MBA5761242.1 hypothetical protein [Vibrio marinisediminis]